jgi:hypothetical protein
LKAAIIFREKGINEVSRFPMVALMMNLASVAYNTIAPNGT